MVCRKGIQVIGKHMTAWIVRRIWTSNCEGWLTSLR
jgi:hypothetical protein